VTEFTVVPLITEITDVEDAYVTTHYTSDANFAVINTHTIYSWDASVQGGPQKTVHFFIAITLYTPNQ